MTKLICGFLVGYYPPLFLLYFVEGGASLVCILGAMVSLVITIAMVRRGLPAVRFAIVWVVAVIVGILPGFLPSAFGAITRARVVGTDNLVQEGRTILATHPAWSDNLRLSEEVGTTPPTLRRLHGSVRVFRDPESTDVVLSHIVVKMYGLGDFAGFTIVPAGQESDGLRIVDGLYWSDESGFWWSFRG